MNPPKRWLTVVTLLYETFLLSFLLLTLKDWLLSGVDFYPYLESVIATVGLLFGCWLALRRSSSTPHSEKTSDKKLNPWLGRLCVVLAVLTFGLLGVFLQDIPHMPWTNDTILGLGLGSRTLQMSFLSGVTDLTPLPPTHTSLGAIVTESGLMAVVTLAGLIVVSAVGLCVTPNVIGAIGLIGIDVLLLRACSAPAFLTLDTVWGTCALAVCIGCLGRGLETSVNPEGSRPVKRKPPVKLAVVALAIVVVLVFSGELVIRHIVDRPPPPVTSVNQVVPLSSISQPMQDATVAMEDGYFYQHHGIDWEALHRAVRFDLRLGEVKQGGSTITEQLAKNLYLQNNDRSIGRKLEDIALAVEMERVMSKRRILELYLNTIDYGMGQHGIAGAAQYYLHRTPAQLTMPEAAILVGIVPDPMQQGLDFERVTKGQQTALGRMVFFFPQRYTQSDSDAAQAIPLNRLVYPDKDAWDRYATEEIPAEWHGVKFYFYASPDEPLPVDNAAQCFKDRLAGFLDDAHKSLHLVGIDHLGLYNDRTTRFSATDLSAHAFGQAMDMSGFRFADGTRIEVVDHRNPIVMKRLAPVEAMLNRHFDAVVDWNDNALHQTHFHVEVKGRRSFPYRAPVASTGPSAYG